MGTFLSDAILPFTIIRFNSPPSCFSFSSITSCLLAVFCFGVKSGRTKTLFQPRLTAFLKFFADFSLDCQVLPLLSWLSVLYVCMYVCIYESICNAPLLQPKQSRVRARRPKRKDVSLACYRKVSMSMLDHEVTVSIVKGFRAGGVKLCPSPLTLIVRVCDVLIQKLRNEIKTLLHTDQRWALE